MFRQTQISYVSYFSWWQISRYIPIAHYISPKHVLVGWWQVFHDIPIVSPHEIANPARRLSAARMTCSEDRQRHGCPNGLHDNEGPRTIAKFVNFTAITSMTVGFQAEMSIRFYKLGYTCNNEVYGGLRYEMCFETKRHNMGLLTPMTPRESWPFQFVRYFFPIWKTLTSENHGGSHPQMP